jgi:ABC-type multidrug transport system fused ATPase/permease subunit
MFCVNNNNFPLALFKLVLAGSYLMSLMGWKPVLAGLGSGALMIPLSTAISNKYGAIHFSLMRYRDGKAHLFTEALQGMRQIKYSALEQHWEDKILKRREEELRQYWKLSIWQCIVIFIITMGPLLLASVAFTVYALENGTHIRASVIFTSLGLFDQLDEAIALLPLLQMYIIEAYTSAVRLDKFFNQTDKEKVSEPGDAISFRNTTVSWPKVEDSEAKTTTTTTTTTNEPAESAESSEGEEGTMSASAGSSASSGPSDNHSMLRDISLEFPVGKLSVITGKTGSGKSLLLAAILGEVKLLSGTVQVPKPPPMDPTPEFIAEKDWIVPELMSFVSQTPWIESGSVRENIVFGLPLDGIRYQTVIRACALEKDLDLLVDGDETEVGPKGVTLSGGQRWRVALARALYSRAGTIILDDVLSAVDTHVGRRIVDEALTGHLAEGRTRILATHHAELVLPSASLLVRLRDGKLDSVETIIPSDEAAHVRLLSEAEAGEDDGEGGNSEHSTIATNGDNGASDGNLAPRKKGKSGQDEEMREEGRVKSKVYYAYYKASGAAFWWIFAASILILSNLLSVGRTWSLKELAQQASADVLPAPSPPSTAHSYVSTTQMYMNTPDIFHTADGSGRGVFFWLAVYVMLGFAISLVQIVRVLAYFYIGLRAARTLFQRMTHAVLRAPLRWTNTVPAGRILNRFTSDTFIVDRRLSTECFALIRSMLNMAIIIATRYVFSPPRALLWT